MMYNQEAERSVLGTVLLEGTLFETLTLEPEHFYEARHQKIYEAMQAVNKKGQAVDVVTVTNELGESINNVGGVMYLTQLAEAVPSISSRKHY